MDHGSQEVEAVEDFSTGHIGLDGLSDKLGQLVGTLEGCGDFDGSAPVVIVEALLIGELGQLFLGNHAGVVGNDVVGRSASAFGDFLCCQMISIHLINREFVEDACSGLRVVDSRLELV